FVQFLLYLPTQSFIFTSSGYGAWKNAAAYRNGSRPHWTHDLPLILLGLNWLSILWLIIGTPPLKLTSAAQFQVGGIWIGILMCSILLICAWILTHYPLTSDLQKRTDQTRTTP